MSALQRRRKERSPAPSPWATFLSAEQYEHFRAIVEGDLRGRGLEPTFREDGAVVVAPAGEEVTLGLVNLAQLCHADDEEAWPARVTEHTTKVLGFF